MDRKLAVLQFCPNALWLVLQDVAPLPVALLLDGVAVETLPQDTETGEVLPVGVLPHAVDLALQGDVDIVDLHQALHAKL